MHRARLVSNASVDIDPVLIMHSSATLAMSLWCWKMPDDFFGFGGNNNGREMEVISDQVPNDPRGRLQSLRWRSVRSSRQNPPSAAAPTLGDYWGPPDLCHPLPSSPSQPGPALQLAPQYKDIIVATILLVHHTPPPHSLPPTHNVCPDNPRAYHLCHPTKRPWCVTHDAQQQLQVVLAVVFFSGRRSQLC